MLPKERRIERKDFSNILTKGTRFNSSRFMLYITKNTENLAKNKTRIAFSVSKKVCPKAVDRNKYRRRGYASLGIVLNKIKPGYFLFFTYKKGSVPSSFQSIETEVSKLLYEARVLE